MLDQFSIRFLISSQCQKYGISSGDKLVMAILYGLVTLCLVNSILAQIPSRGPCPTIKSLSNFNVSAFTGDWYEASSYFSMFELTGKCIKHNFEFGKKNGYFLLDIRYISGLTGKCQSYHMVLQQDSKNSATFKFKFPLTPPGAVIECSIVETDYNNYAVIHSCTEYGHLHLQYAWILTKTRNPEKCVIDEAYKISDLNKIERKYFWETDQKHC